MSARRINWLRGFFALGVGTLLILSQPGTAKAVLTIQLSSVVTDAAGTTVLATQNVTSAGVAFPGPVTILTPAGTAIGGGLVVTGPSGASHTASGPNTTFNNTVGSLLQSLVDQITNTNTGAAGTRNATVVISANGFEAPIPASVNFNFTSTFLNAAGSSITARFFEDTQNRRSSVTASGNTVTQNLFGTQVGITPTFTPATNASTAFSFQGTNSLPSNVPFSLTLQFQLTLVSGGNLQSRAQAEQVLPAAAVPEPSTVVMALCGLPALGGLALRRRLRRA